VWRSVLIPWWQIWRVAPKPHPLASLGDEAGGAAWTVEIAYATTRCAPAFLLRSAHGAATLAAAITGQLKERLEE
jgi:hypothetical protein